MCLLVSTIVSAKDVALSSPDGNLTVTVGVDAGRACYQVSRSGQVVINRSALGFVLKDGDFKDAEGVIKRIKNSSFFNLNLNVA